MKFLIFEDPDERQAKIGAEFERKLVGGSWVGVGGYEDKDAKVLLKLVPEHLRREISEDAYLSIKKKGPIAYRLLTPIQQRADRDPNAVYADQEEEAPSKPASELVSVGDAKVEDPLEDTDDDA